MARPLTPIDEGRVRDLASIGLNTNQIAARIGVDWNTINSRFSEVIRQGHLQGSASVREMIWNRARSGCIQSLFRLDDRMNGPIAKKLEITKEMAIEVLESELNREGISALTVGEESTPNQSEPQT